MDSVAQLQLLEDRIASLAGLVERVQSATTALFTSSLQEAVNLVALVQKAVAESDAIRDDAIHSFSAAGVSIEWADMASLLELLRSARGALAERQASAALAGIRRLADSLDTGKVTHHLARTRDKLNELRQKAVEELRGTAGPLPGPPDTDAWLSWFWAAGDAAEQAFDDIRSRLPSLADFLEMVTREQWQPGTATPFGVAAGLEAGKIEVPAAASQPGVSPLADTQRLVAIAHDDSLDIAASVAPLSSPATVAPGEAAIKPDNSTATTDSGPVVDTDQGDTTGVSEEGGPTEVNGGREQHAGRAPEPNGVGIELRPTPRRAEFRQPPHLNPDEATFEDFCKQHWVAPNGTCEAAPWRLPGFVDNLTETFFRAIEEEKFGRAMVFAIAAADLHCEDVPTLEEGEAWARLWQRPRETIGLESVAVSLLRGAAGDGRLDGSRIWKLRLCLEALRPSRELPLSDSEAKSWVDAACFSSGPLREMLVLLLRIGRATNYPIEEIRRVLKAVGVSRDDLVHILEEKRKEFHAEVRKYWSSVGGKVTRTHCRRAWDEFVAQVKPTLEALYPPTQGGKTDWDADEVSRQVNRFQRIHKEIADRWDAKFRDRSTMDRRAESFALKAAELNDLYRKIKAAREEERVRTVSDDEMIRKSELFLGDSVGGDTFEECCRRLIIRHIELKIGVEHRTGLTADDLLAYPALLGCIASGQDLSQGSGRDEIVPIADVVAPSAAAAVLLEPPRENQRLRQGEKLVDRLASLLLPARRHDLLAPLAPHLAASDQARLRTVRNELMADTMKVYGEARRAWEKLGDLASAREDSPLKAALDYAANRMKSASSEEAARPDEHLYFKGWLERLAAFAARLLSHAIESFRQSVLAEANPGEAEILKALDDGCYADAVYLRSEATGLEGPKVARRQTAWRKGARGRYHDPSLELKTFRQNLKQPIRGSSELDELIAKWLAGVTGSLSEDQRLRTKFADVVFADTFGGEREQLRGQGKSERSHFWILCQKVRESLALQGLNPSFLPQLARAEELVFVTPPTKVSDPGLVQQTANLIAGSHASKLVAILAPRISIDQRSALLHELRQRKLTAAVIDSLDLCRLLNVGGRRINLVLGLLEVMLEQQRWVDLSPFHAHDGAQARIEMYVGRAQEANVLATDNKYSRLFSGRKLGKSALLKFVEEKYDGSRLPSGNILRVLRIPIVGIQSDAMVVNKVLAELRGHLKFQPSAPAENTADAFLDALAEFLKARPDENLLVILDEADVFVEKQLEEYDLYQERCLSFRIRSDAQKEVDRQGLPRIRFVFAGYRKANTRGGAWGNWGDPLLLNPLEADEAADLIAGPLARLGIDAADVAPSIAYRCGYQPAVLLRFGERLLDVFDNRFPDVACREHVVVTATHVAEVYQHQAIQDEIRTVVRNNFQGNEAGQAVFAATLLAFAGLAAPGDALVNAPERIWEQLRELVEGNPDVEKVAAGISWLVSRSPDGRDPTEVGLNEIKKHLEDFHERKLLVLVNRDDGVYKLRFPYHHSSLLVGVQDEAWAALLRLGRGTASSLTDDRTGDPVSPSTLRDLETVLRKHAELGLHHRAAVLGTLWLDSVANQDWLANRLGFDPDRLSRPGQPRDPAAAAFLEMTPVEAQGLLASRAAEAPPAFLLGGVDLLRWGLQAVQSGEVVEVQAQGRLSRSAVERWFRRTREFGFDRDEMEQIGRLTGRIPYLVHLFDRCLRETVSADGGVHVGPEDFGRATTKYEKRLPECLGHLASGTAAVRLAAREVELLLMAAVVARMGEFKHPVLYQDLGEYWEGKLYEEAWKMKFPTRAYPAAWTDGVEDRLAAKVVTDLGLLPHPLDQQPADVALTPDDPLVRWIVPALAKAGR